MMMMWWQEEVLADEVQLAEEVLAHLEDAGRRELMLSHLEAAVSKGGGAGVWWSLQRIQKHGESEMHEAN